MLLLIPSAVVLAVLAEPITRLVYERGVFGDEATDLVADGAGLVVDLAPLPGREPALLAHVLQPPAAVGDGRALAREPPDQRGPFGGALQALRDRRDRDRDRGGDDRDVRLAGLDPAPQPARRRGPGDGRFRRADAGGLGAARGRGLRGLVRPRRAYSGAPSRTGRVGRRRDRRRRRRVHRCGLGDGRAEMQQIRTLLPGRG